jgi:hypothetical protein
MPFCESRPGQEPLQARRSFRAKHRAENQGGSYRVVPVAATTHAHETPPSMTTDALRFELELQLARDPIEGRLSGEHGQAISFTGWLELMTLLEQALASASDREPTESDSPP